MTENIKTDDGSGANDLESFLNQAKGEIEGSPQVSKEKKEEIEEAKEAVNNRYTILQRDVGKTLGDIISETSGIEEVRLSDDELNMLDDFIMNGYASMEFKMGTKSSIELQTAPSIVVLVSDEEIANFLKRHDTTNIGAARLNSVHLASVYLHKYGLHYPSWPADAQPKGSHAEAGSLRKKFESEEGLRNRIDFCMELDGMIVDRISSKLRLFQAKCTRVLSYEGLEDF